MATKKTTAKKAPTRKRSTKAEADAQARIDKNPANAKNQTKASKPAKTVAALDKALGTSIKAPKPKNAAAIKIKAGSSVKDAKEAAAGGKAAASAKASNFMDDKRDEDRTDAISKAVLDGLKSTQPGVKELHDALRLGISTSCERTRRQLLEHARQLSGTITTALQETITKGKAASDRGGVQW